MTRCSRRVGVLGILLAFGACTAPSRPEDLVATPPTHGVLVGEVRTKRARIWARSDRAGWMHVAVTLAAQERSVAAAHKQVNADTDFATNVEVAGLQANTKYCARVWFTPKRNATAPPDTAVERAWFSTAPDPDDTAAVSFAWSGDLAGQNVGRDAQQGFAILPRILERKPDFFIGLGDMIYGDLAVASVGLYGNAQVPGDFAPSASLEAYRAHWRYNRADRGLQQLLARTPYYAVWDDHEVANDFSPSEDTRSEPPFDAKQHLLPLGYRAFCDYNTIGDDHGERLYRSIRWGKHLELFFLDNRSFRDPNRARDDSPTPKTQLGVEQLDWLEGALAASDATWRIVISSVPIAIPTGSPTARDGWANADSATGFERELALLFATLRVRDIGNTIWLTTDVHFATGFEYTPFPEAPDFHVREFVAGPLSAGIFPTQALDPTFRPRRIFFHGPPVKPASYDEALNWFNFGMLTVDGAGRLTIEIVDGRGATVASQVFER